MRYIYRYLLRAVYKTVKQNICNISYIYGSNTAHAFTINHRSWCLYVAVTLVYTCRKNWKNFLNFEQLGISLTFDASLWVGDQVYFLVTIKKNANFCFYSRIRILQLIIFVETSQRLSRGDAAVKWHSFEFTPVIFCFCHVAFDYVKHKHHPKSFSLSSFVFTPSVADDPNKHASYAHRSK